MKNLVYGGILMITGMLGIIILFLLLYFLVDVVGASVPAFFFIAPALLLAVMVIAGYIEHVRPAMKNRDSE